jgi:hypothetical protein
MRHVFLALTNPVPGREAEFNVWYDDFHLREVVEYGSGMIGGRRFRLSADQRPGQAPSPWSYLAWYDLEHGDLAEYHRSPWIPDRPALKPFAGLVADGHVGWIYTPTGAWVGAPADPERIAEQARYLFMALTNPVPGREQAFDDWYDASHVPEIVASLPGFVAGRRYRAATDQRQNQMQPPWSRLAVYEVVAESSAALHRAAEGVKALTRPPAATLDPEHVAWVFEPVGPYYTRRS